MRHRRCQACLFAAVVFAGSVFHGWADAATAPNIVFDLRVATTGGKEVTLANVGDTVTLNLFAIVTGLDGDIENESMNIGSGSFQSSTGGLKGDLRGLSPPFPFNATGSTIGVQSDLDGDGDLDVGTTAADSQNNAYAFRAGSFQPNFAEGQFVGRTRFTLTTASDAVTEVNYYQRPVGALQAWFDGVLATNTYGGISFSNAAPVVIRGVASNPGVQYIHGTIATHQSITANTAVTPGQTLTFSTGFDVTSTGTLTAPAASATINDATSGNAGGTLLFGAVNVGGTAGGVFTHSGGYTKLTSLNAGSSAQSGTFTVSGGNIEPGSVTIGGNGLLRQQGGTSTLDSLLVTGDVEMLSGALSVTGATTLGSGGSVTVSGGTIDLNGPMSTAAGSLLRIEGGLLNTSMTGPYQGLVEQVAGEFHAGGAFVVGAVGGGAGNYSITGGIFTGSSLKVIDGGLFTQQAGTIAPTTGVFVWGGSQATPTRYLLQGGTLTGRSISVATHGGQGATRDDSYGTFVQAAGVVDVQELKIDKLGVYQMSGGTLRVSKNLYIEGTLDLSGAAVPVTFARNTFADFTQGTLTAANNATFFGEAGSLMSFKAGFDPLTQIGSIQTQGLVHVAGQPLSIPPSKSVGGSGTIQGDVTNNGTVAPGNSPGALIIAGDYTQADNGTLAIEIAGKATDAFDSLTVEGDAVLDGLLNLSLLDGFVPQSSDSFAILSAATLGGAFDNAPGSIDFTGGRFDVLYSPTSVTLTNFQAIPEPASLALLAAAGIGLALRRRRCCVG